MKLTIDFDNKEIVVDKPVELHVLIETLDNLFKNGEWKEYVLRIDKHEIIVEKQPYVWPVIPQYPPWDWTQPIVISSGNNSDSAYKDIR